MLRRISVVICERSETTNEQVSGRGARVFLFSLSHLLSFLLPPHPPSRRRSQSHQRRFDLEEWVSTHDQTTSLRINLYISRQNPNRTRVEGLLEVSKLLVRKSFDRGGVDGPRTYKQKTRQFLQSSKGMGTRGGSRRRAEKGGFFGGEGS